MATTGGIVQFPGTPPRPPGPPRQPSGRRWAGQAYLHVRGRCRDEAEAIGRLLQVLSQRASLPAYAPPADRALLEQWAVKDVWEAAWRRREAQRALSDPAIQSDQRLRDLAAVAQWARDVLDRAYERAQGGSGDSSDREVSESDVRAWQAAHTTWVKAVDRLVEAEGEVRRRHLEQAASREWQQKRQRVERELLVAYQDLGPQYSILARRLASLEVRLQQMETSGRDVAAGEYAELLRLHVSVTNQLQRYTENVQVDAVQQAVSSSVQKVLEVLSRHVQVAPAVWEQVQAEIRRELLAQEPA